MADDLKKYIADGLREAEAKADAEQRARQEVEERQSAYLEENARRKAAAMEAIKTISEVLNQAVEAFREGGRQARGTPATFGGSLGEARLQVEVGPAGTNAGLLYRVTELGYLEVLQWPPSGGSTVRAARPFRQNQSSIDPLKTGREALQASVEADIRRFVDQYIRG